MRSSLNQRSSLLSLALLLSVFSLEAQMQPARVIILIGPPGSGKTVQSAYLSKRFRIPAISMAQLLEQEVGRKTTLGKALAASLASGELMTDGPANELMKARLLRPDAGRGFVLDGYPTTEGQAKALDEFLAAQSFPPPTVVMVDAPDEVLRSRMVERRRADDRPATIDRRLTEYRETGRLVEKWYGADHTVRVDGTGQPSAVAVAIANAIDSAASRKGLQTRPAEEKVLRRRPAAEPAAPTEK